MSLVPVIQRPLGSQVEGMEKSYIAFLVGPALLGAGPPWTVAPGTPLQSDNIYVYGFNTFALFVSATGGNLAIDYGICHPMLLGTVLAFRNVFPSGAVSASMYFTWGAAGLSVPALAGDLFTAFTLRFTASGSNVTLNSCVLWCGVR